MDLLNSYDWPGNVRELANVIGRSVLLSVHREEIIVDDFPEGMLSFVRETGATGRIKPKGAFSKLARLEEEYIAEVLSSVGGNKSKAARMLGITMKTLYSKLGRNSK